MRRCLCILLMLFLAVMPSGRHALGEEGAVFACPEDRADCLLLQTVLEGEFENYDPDDMLLGRVLAAVYPKLCAITEEGIRHCAEELSMAESEVRLSLYRALRNALWADLIHDSIPKGKMDDADRILLLFADPASQEDADYQMAQIRQNMTDAVLQALAASANAPLAFIEWLIREG